MCLIWRSSGSGSRSDSWAKARAEIRQREMASKTKRDGVGRKSFGAEYVSMQLPPVFNRPFIMDIALHKHSAHINILLNPEEGLRKEFTFRSTGCGRPRHRSSTSRGTC